MNLTNNAFATQTTYDQFGRTNSKTINVDGNVSSFIYGGAGFPILDRKIEFQPGFNGSFNRYKSMIGTQENITDKYSITSELEINFQYDSLDIDLAGYYSYNKPISSFSSVSKSR